MFNGKGKFLDVSGGYGLLTRLMRDIGFDCYTTDKYCQNLFAKAFEPTDKFEADALFAFEVLEHIENPLKFLSKIFMKSGCKTLIFST
ncbi:methyltransferase domain-containing protein [Chlorogloeopsis sp. ULAP01]|uniref:methyltransferase domain-containing protein n=1 Tax=Chlorogloeopsis sp. ULAP01 TaxID=3056483 RepID=UPI0025AAB3B7|nr:methyltransferase domain-containing protein [Chlorogloeopsis sp. ULAP01]MDM9385349.1 methyltransferase domain-containing protein [Chlorogloeopsis sp. ULAP01]